LGVRRQAFYEWLKRPPSKRALQDRALKSRIRIAHAESRGTYGSPRITAELRERGHRIGVNRVARLMKEEGIQGKSPRRFKKTTDSEHLQPVAPNLLERDFSTDAPDQVWVTDITYIRTWEGWLYLAVILDLFSRKVVGWSLKSHMRTALCLQALDRALAIRSPEPGWIHHSDQGSQYASEAYQKRLEDAGARPSMSRRGDCWDNAVAESFFGTLKTELESRIGSSRGAARAAIRDDIHHFYNPVRRHSANGQVAPDVLEQRYREEFFLIEAA
jgi:transposase InsO family protein